MNVHTFVKSTITNLPQVGRRTAGIVLSCFFIACGADQATADGTAWAALKKGGTFVLMRHGAAQSRNDPRTLSPGNCARERNLSNRGRKQAAQIGEAFRRRGISITTVLASPYCRTKDTARLAFGTATLWTPLALTIAVSKRKAAARTGAVMDRIRKGAGSGNIVMVTHRPNIKVLTYISLAPAELLVVKKDKRGGLTIIGRISPAKAR